MSDSERPEITAFLHLEHVVRSLGDELASFRRRALAAEARLRELQGDGSAGSGGGTGSGGRSNEALEEEIAGLRERLEGASERTRQMIDRVRFLRQQQDRGE